MVIIVENCTVYPSELKNFNPTWPKHTSEYFLDMFSQSEKVFEKSNPKNFKATFKKIFFRWFISLFYGANYYFFKMANIKKYFFNYVI